jgi:glycosyltransferase involved in cell wall biosynthesis
MILNIISPHLSHYLGGMEVVTANMAICLAKQGVTIRVFTRQTKQQTDIYEYLLSKQSSRLRVIEIPVDTSCPYPDGSWSTFYRIACDFGVAAKPFYTKYSDADLFITHLAVDTLFVPSHSKTVLHLHGSPYQIDPLMSAAVQIPDSTIAGSDSIQKWWTHNYPKLQPTVFLNGINTSYFDGDTKAHRSIDILYVGRFLEHKGIDDILRAVQPTHHVVIAGNGPYLKTLRAIASERDLKHVVFYDTPSTTVIKKLYQDAKIFACPSRAKEGLLTTLLEAASSGCAIVTTSGSGMTDLVQHKTEGIVVPPRDSKTLRSSFEDLLKSDEKRIKIAQHLQAKVRKGWSWDQKAVELRGLYKNAI